MSVWSIAYIAIACILVVGNAIVARKFDGYQDFSDTDKEA